MVLLKRRLSIVLIVTALIPASAAAQERFDSTIGRPVTRPAESGHGTLLAERTPSLNVEPAWLSNAVLPAIHANDRTAANWQTTPKPKRRAMGWAIAIGVGAGVSVAGMAASTYGENEGGAFCARCFTEWSAIAIPVGAGVGAAVGYLIDRARR